MCMGMSEKSEIMRLLHLKFTRQSNVLRNPNRRLSRRRYNGVNAPVGEAKMCNDVLLEEPRYSSRKMQRNCEGLGRKDHNNVLLEAVGA